MALPAPSTAAASEAPTPRDVLEMRTGLPGDEVRRRLAGAARSEELGRRVLCFYLVEMEARRLYQSTGHGSTAHYAEARLALDRRRTAELLRVGAKLLELRQLDQAFCAGRLGWGKVLVVARMATPEHEAAWLERALALDVRALTLLAARSKEGGPPRQPGDEKGLPEIRFPVAASVGPLTHAKLEQAQRRLAAELGRGVDVAGLFDALLDQFLATESDGSAPGRKRVDASAFRVQLLEGGRPGGPLRVETEDGPLPVDAGGPGSDGALSESVRCDAGVRTQHGHDHRARDVKTPAGMRRRVLRRDGHRCRSCRSRWSLMVHHVEFRSHGGRTHFENLITLCSRCHGLVHANLLAIDGTSADAARFLDAAGRAVAGPEAIATLEAGAAGQRADSLQVAPPQVGSPHASAPSESAVGGVVTLVALPEQVDAAWWRRHAHLVRDRGENGSLRFEAGVPLEAPEPSAAPPAPPEAAFAGVLGQDERIARLRGTAAGARARGKPFPHVLLTGPAGTGKTTLARGIAAVTQRPLVEVSAPLVADRSTWVRLLAGLAEGSVLFLDEAHALPGALLDALLQALAECRLSLVLSDGIAARRVTLRLPTFTLVAATTDEGRIPAALRSRFGLRETLVHYEEAALAEIVRQAATAEGAELSTDGAQRLARASRGTPREALRLLDRALDHVVGEGAAPLDEARVARTLAGLGYDGNDLDLGEQRYLCVLRESPTPVPLSRLARLLGTTARTLVEHVEPWLFARGYARMTPGGRTATPHAWRPDARLGAPNVRRGRLASYSTS